MTEAEKRLHRCCFTGHRPEKLKRPSFEIQMELEKEIRQTFSDGYTVFISGMARGVDIWAAEIVVRLRGEGLPLRLICASPYEGFEARWSAEWRDRYIAIMKTADLVRFICHGYSRDCFQTRNEWMVAHSARVIAVYNGQPGGTKNTIDYAHKLGISVHAIEG